MYIITKESGPLNTNSYLLVDEETKDAVIIDAPIGIWEQFQPIIKNKGLKLQAVLLTHTHWDHTLDINQIYDQTKTKVFVHKNDTYRLLDPQNNTIFRLPFDIEPFDKFENIEDNQKLKFGNLLFNVLHTPGHTEGGVCYVNIETKSLFAGDTIFAQSIGRTDLPGGSEQELLASIHAKIMTLPNDYTIYSGHGQSTTVEIEKLYNPFLR